MTATPWPSGKSVRVPMEIRVGIGKLRVKNEELGAGKSFSSTLHASFFTHHCSRWWETIQAHGVVVDDLAGVGFRNRGEVLRHLLTGEWPHPFGMRIVRAPHQVIYTHQLTGQNAGPIVLEGGVELAMKIGARRLGQARLHPTLVIVPPVVHEP